MRFTDSFLVGKTGKYLLRFVWLTGKWNWYVTNNMTLKVWNFIQSQWRNVHKYYRRSIRICILCFFTCPSVTFLFWLNLLLSNCSWHLCLFFLLNLICIKLPACLRTSFLFMKGKEIWANIYIFVWVKIYFFKSFKC